jgi:ABC-type transporter Mla maintaining outer membrane lipid asymmetry ATPase subunit MlaF
MIADLIIKLRDLRGDKLRDSRGGERSSDRATLLTVTNDMQRAYQLADRIFLLSGGHLREGGAPEAVRTTRDPELREFVTGQQA